MKGFHALMQMGSVLMLSVALCLSANAETASERLPAKAFSALPKFKRPSLSPSAVRLAFIQNISEPEAVSVLTTFDIISGKTFYLLKSDNEKVKINWFRWANDDRLVISARYESRQGTQRFYETRLYSMRFDDQGEEPVNLIDWRRLSSRFRSSNHTPQFQDRVIDWLPDDPDHILMSIDLETQLLPSVYKVSVEDARMSRIERGKRQIREWTTDQQGNVRIGEALDYESGERTVYYRKTADDDWETLFEYNAMKEKGFYPRGFAFDPNILYYSAYKGDYLALYKMDLTTKESTEVYADPDYDVDGSLIYSPVTRDAIGVNHAQAENGEYYWDDRYDALQRGLDMSLPDMDNYLVSFSRDENAYILYSESDTTPGAYYLGRRKERKLDILFEQYPQIPLQILSEHSKITYTSRDGMEIEGYLSLPKTGKAPYPTVIHPHGGPGARDYDGFDYWTSFFTNRGYAVLRPNFRGSSGYGYNFEQAQMKAWGLQMQDDITDATKWMVSEGIADPEHMCIVGASYGGYAALMATVKTPDLFQCAVSFAGVSSLKHVVMRSRRFVNKEFVKNQIGDDYDDLEDRSPLYNIEPIKTPILLVHGDEDRVVEVRQSRMMADELEDEDKVFKYVELEAGDHYLSIQRNRHRLFDEMDAFLSQYLTQ